MGLRATLALGLVVTLASCGGGGSSNGRATLNLWVFNEPSGSFADAAKRCSTPRYTIKLNALSNNADQQRQSLVQRLAAKDSTIDLMGMDVVWTAEFGAAGWIKPFPRGLAAQISRGTLAGPLRTAIYKGRLYAAPANSNTQLLWYDKRKVKTVPRTWHQLIAEAVKLHTHVEVQGAEYEGLMVWFNSLNASAGGSIIVGNRVTLGAPGRVAARVMSDLANSPAADPSLSSDKEDQGRLAFDQGKALFQVNYPFVYPSAKADDPALYRNMGWAPYPAVVAGKPARAPVGGINWGVSSYGKHIADSFQAAACLRNLPNQREAAIKGGLPPTLASLYNNPGFLKSYPFGRLIRASLNTGAVRPVTPAYADVSLAVAESVWPPKDIELNGFVQRLRQKLKDALNSSVLL